jgi:hypothetical protein
VVVGPDGPVRLAVIIVPMEDGARCVLAYEFFVWLMANGYTDQFFYSRNSKTAKKRRSYVCTSHEDKTNKAVRVHHLVYGRKGRAYIGFKDGDPLNLLRSNLGPARKRPGQLEKARAAREQ